MYRLWKGGKVEIWQFVDGEKEFLGIGKYIGSTPIGNSFLGRKQMPRFKVGRRKIWGCACWWIPVNVAKKKRETEGR